MAEQTAASSVETSPCRICRGAGDMCPHCDGYGRCGERCCAPQLPSTESPQETRDLDQDVFVGDRPRDGDLVRVIRTRVEVHEGYWRECGPEDYSETGRAWLCSAEDGRRVRTEGQVDFGSYVESDTVEVIEHRHGAAFDDIIESERAATREEARVRRARYAREARSARWGWLFRLLGSTERHSPDPSAAQNIEDLEGDPRG